MMFLEVPVSNLPRYVVLLHTLFPNGLFLFPLFIELAIYTQSQNFLRILPLMEVPPFAVGHLRSFHLLLDRTPDCLFFYWAQPENRKLVFFLDALALCLEGMQGHSLVIHYRQQML